MPTKLKVRASFDAASLHELEVRLHVARREVGSLMRTLTVAKRQKGAPIAMCERMRIAAVCADDALERAREQFIDRFPRPVEGGR